MTKIIACGGCIVDETNIVDGGCCTSSWIIVGGTSGQGQVNVEYVGVGDATQPR